MADEFDLLESFKVFIRAAEEGTVIPSVSDDDIKTILLGGVQGKEVCIQPSQGTVSASPPLALPPLH